MNTADALKNQLRTLNIFTMRTDIQAEVVAKLEGGAVSPADVAKLLRFAESTHKTKQAAIGAVCGVLRMGIEHIRDAIRQIPDDTRKVVDANDAAVAKTTASAPRFACAENPYGWSSPETMRGADHGEIGTWNPFRQCYNMTMAEMRREIGHAGVHDARRRGCSRFEVLGKAGKVKPKARWDDAEGARLRHLSSLSEPIGGGTVTEEEDRPVYGEG